MSVMVDDEHDDEELQAVDTLRQALILEELLPSKHDDFHMMLRCSYLIDLLSLYYEFDDLAALASLHQVVPVIVLLNLEL